MRHLKRHCAEEGSDSVKDLLKAVELKEKKYKEEETDFFEKNHLETGAEAITKKRKSGRTTFVLQKLPSLLSYEDIV